jgi:molecular chaperone DnaJ
MPNDYYKTLGVDKSASQDEIKKAFRKEAHKYHPDKPNGDEEKFKEANAAYQVLGDADKRAKYDQYGSAAFEGGAGGGGGFGQGFGGFDFSGAEGFGDIFGDIFGGGRNQQRERKGNDIQIDLDLTFSEAVFGVEKELDLTKVSNCERCGGTGGEPGEAMNTCGGCHGEGVQMKAHRTVLGVMQSKVTCSECEGLGEKPKVECKDCSGSGLDKGRHHMEVKIPAGVDNGATLRLRGEGEAMKGGASGDLYVRLHVKRDKRFEREGATIHSTVKIGFTQAAVGDTIDVDTVDGSVELKIPHGTQSHTQFRLRGKGVPTRRGRGDHLVLIEVVVPKKLTHKQVKMLKELDLTEK